MSPRDVCFSESISVEAAPKRIVIHVEENVEERIRLAVDAETRRILKEFEIKMEKERKEKVRTVSQNM